MKNYYWYFHCHLFLDSVEKNHFHCLCVPSCDTKLYYSTWSSKIRRIEVKDTSENERARASGFGSINYYQTFEIETAVKYIGGQIECLVCRAIEFRWPTSSNWCSREINAPAFGLIRFTEGKKREEKGEKKWIIFMTIFSLCVCCLAFCVCVCVLHSRLFTANPININILFIFLFWK